MTHRIQCPFGPHFHDRDALPKCHVHGLGYSPRCADCVRVAGQIPCGGSQS